MAKINVVLEGIDKDCPVCIDKNNIIIAGQKVTKKDVASYTVIDETNKDQYSIWKGALGVALLGGFGAVAGIGGKNKKEYLIAIDWVLPKSVENNRSLLLLDERYYKTFIKSMF